MEEQDRVAIIQQFGRTYRAFMSAFEAQVGHPMPRWRMMLALHEQARRVVAEASGRAPAGRSGRADAAVEDARSAWAGLRAAWIERDNRVTNVRLTEAGQAATEASLPRRNAFLHDTMAALPDDALARCRAR